MTATTEPPTRESRPRRAVRFASMESLGFSNPSASWSDTPAQKPVGPMQGRGRHEAPAPEPETVADWKPEEFGRQLVGGNFRWSLLILIVVISGGLAGLAYWLYQRPAAQAEASVVALTEEAQGLDVALPALTSFNDSLVGGEDVNAAELFVVDEAARALFNASGQIQEPNSELRSAAASASAAALDGVRLAGDANSYRLAVSPILVPPDLETDPSLIELDEAARSFGTWQLRFDEVRTALPDQTLTNTTEQLDILSGDLPNILTRYMDALREDDETEAANVVTELALRLEEVGQLLTESLTVFQARVSERIAETTSQLDEILGG